MELELLLSLGCLFSTQNACMSLGEAYYHEKHLDDVYKNVESKYPKFIFTASLLSSIEKRKASVPIYKGIYLSTSPESTEIGYKKGW